MQGVYYRRNVKYEWVLVRETRSVADAEKLVRHVAKEKRAGRLLYVEALSLPTSLWDMRGLAHRRLGGWLCKSVLPGYQGVKKAGRRQWVPCDAR